MSYLLCHYSPSLSFPPLPPFSNSYNLLFLFQPSAPCESVKHTVIWVEESAKRKRLVAFLNDWKLFK